MSTPLTRQKVRARVALWQRRLYLEHWKIMCRFSPKEGHTAHCAVKRSEFDIDYLELELYFDLERKDPEGDLFIDDENLDAYVIHELASHTALWPLGAFAEALVGRNQRLRRLLTRAEEHSAVMLERILLRAWGLEK